MQPPLPTQHEYSPGRFSKIFHCITAAGILGVVFYLHSLGPFKHPADEWFVSPPFAVIAILSLLNLRRKVIISSDRIINRSLFTTKEIPLHAIKGRRLQVRLIVLEPSSAEYPRLLIGDYNSLANGGELLEWVTTNFEDLDAADRETAQQQLLQDESLGNSAESRQRLLDRAKTIVPIYNTAAIITAFICMLNKGSYSSLLMLLLPLAGIFLLFTHKGLVKFYAESARTIYPVVLWGIMFTSFIMLLDGLFNYNLLGLPHVWLPAVLTTAIIGTILYKKGIHPAGAPVKTQKLLIAMVALAYGFGSVIQLNCAFDHSTPTAYKAIVQERFSSSGRSSGQYYLVLAPWGPAHSSTQVQVSRLLYRVSYVGDTVTVRLRHGLLQVPWYWVEK